MRENVVPFPAKKSRGRQRARKNPPLITIETTRETATVRKRVEVRNGRRPVRRNPGSSSQLQARESNGAPDLTDYGNNPEAVCAASTFPRAIGCFFACRASSAFLEIAFIALVGLPISQADSNVSHIGDGLNPWLTASHLTGWLAALGLIALAIAALRFWKTQDLGWWVRIHGALLLLASALFISFAWCGHLLSPSLRF